MARSFFWIGCLLMTAGLWAIAPEFGLFRQTVAGPGEAGWAMLAIGALLVAVSVLARLRGSCRQTRPRADEDAPGR